MFEHLFPRDQKRQRGIIKKFDTSVLLYTESPWPVEWPRALRFRFLMRRMRPKTSPGPHTAHYNQLNSLPDKTAYLDGAELAADLVIDCGAAARARRPGSPLWASPRQRSRRWLWMSASPPVSSTATPPTCAGAAGCSPFPRRSARSASASVARQPRAPLRAGRSSPLGATLYLLLTAYRG